MCRRTSDGTSPASIEGKDASILASQPVPRFRANLFGTIVTVPTRHLSPLSLSAAPLLAKLATRLGNNLG